MCIILFIGLLWFQAFDWSATPIGALGIVDDADIIRFVPRATYSDTHGTLERYLNGSELGLTTHLEDIKALATLTDGRILLSTVGAVNVDGTSGQDEDLLLLTPETLNTPSNGQDDSRWRFYFDGSDVGLGDSSYEDIWGVSIGPSGSIYLTTRADYAITDSHQTELNGTQKDILSCMPSALGVETSCHFQQFWIGQEHGLDGQTIDGLHLSF